MPIPKKDFNGKVLLSFGYCTEQGQYTQKDLDEIDFFDYYDTNDIIEDGDKIEVFNNLKGKYEEVELIECKIESNQLNIDNELYTYIEEDDVFMSLNYDTHNVFVKIHAIYDTCASCESKDECVIPYCFNEKWICNSCILDGIEYYYYYGGRNA